MNGTWVKNYREIQDWKFYKRPDYAHLWQHIIRQAHHGEVSTYDSYGNEIKSGQFSTGRRRLSRETGINESKVERILKHLEIEQQIEQLKTSKCRVISITKWDSFQKSNNEVNNKRTTSEQQVNNKRTQNKNVKNVKNKYIDQIESIYLNSYPRKSGKSGGIKKLVAQIKTDEDISRLKVSVENYSAECNGRESKYIKQFSTFANCWEDYIGGEADIEKQRIEQMRRELNEMAQWGECE